MTRILEYLYQHGPCKGIEHIDPEEWTGEEGIKKGKNSITTTTHVKSDHMEKQEKKYRLTLFAFRDRTKKTKLQREIFWFYPKEEISMN